MSLNEIIITGDIDDYALEVDIVLQNAVYLRSVEIYFFLLLLRVVIGLIALLCLGFLAGLHIFVKIIYITLV